MSTRTSISFTALASLLPLTLACGGSTDEEASTEAALSAPISNPFSFASGRDELLSCNGIAGRTASGCQDISDANQKALCQALASRSQQPCLGMTDRNLQLSCYGMSINIPSNCRSITNINVQQFCYGVSGHTLSNCTAVTDRNSQLMCYAMADGISSNCRDITNANDRNFCYAVSAHNTSSCASIPNTCSTGFKLCGNSCIANAACCSNADCPISNGLGTCSAGACMPTATQCNPSFNLCGSSCSSVPCCSGTDTHNCPVVANGTAACVNQACIPTCDVGFSTCASSPSTALCLPVGECCSGPACGVDPARELFINDPNVINDPRTFNGNWSFQHLMQGLSGQASDPSAFVLSWLRNWLVNETVNGFSAAPRANINNAVILPWLVASGCSIQPGCDCSTGVGCALNFALTPFKLKAIVSRLDLRSSVHAGEGRFIFGLNDPNGVPQRFTAIFEYELGTSARSVQQWAGDWHALGSLPLGSPQYNQALETITERFAGLQVAPGRQNGSALHQLRTNEILLAAPWELREFHLGTNGLLVEAGVAQTPDDASSNQPGGLGAPGLAAWINANSAAIMAGTHQLPASMLGAASPNRNNQTPTWFVQNVIDPQVMARFSRATCAGCHGQDTGTFFLHLDPLGFGDTALSAFVRTAELPRREADLMGILNGTASLTFSAIHAAALSE